MSDKQPEVVYVYPRNNVQTFVMLVLIGVILYLLFHGQAPQLGDVPFGIEHGSASSSPVPTSQPRPTAAPPAPARVEQAPVQAQAPAQPAQVVPPTAIPATAIPPTVVPPTAIPPTAIPPTAVPPVPTSLPNAEALGQPVVAPPAPVNGIGEPVWAAPTAPQVPVSGGGGGNEKVFAN